VPPVCQRNNEQEEIEQKETKGTKVGMIVRASSRE
jgi:hypothetical protein